MTVMIPFYRLVNNKWHLECVCVCVSVCLGFECENVVGFFWHSCSHRQCDCCHSFYLKCPATSPLARFSPSFKTLCKPHIPHESISHLFLVNSYCSLWLCVCVVCVSILVILPLSFNLDWYTYSPSQLTWVSSLIIHSFNQELFSTVLCVLTKSETQLSLVSYHFWLSPKSWSCLPRGVWAASVPGRLFSVLLLCSQMCQADKGGGQVKRTWYRLVEYTIDEFTCVLCQS